MTYSNQYLTAKLLDAAALLLKDGWCRHHLDERTAAAAAGALYEAEIRGVYPSEITGPPGQLRPGRRDRGQGIISWNDRQDGTAARWSASSGSQPVQSGEAEAREEALTSTCARTGAHSPATSTTCPGDRRCRHRGFFPSSFPDASSPRSARATTTSQESRADSPATMRAGTCHTGDGRHGSGSERPHGARDRAARDHPKQPREADSFYGGDLDALLEDKLDECHPAFIESLLAEGIRTPVLVRNGRLVDGHHRLAVALDRDLDVPYAVITGRVPVGYYATGTIWSDGNTYY